MSKFDDVNHGEGVWRKSDDLRFPEKQYQPPKAITVTNESCWHISDMIPNPPKSNIHDMVDKLYTEMSAENKHNTEVIMAHEFREHPEGFKDIAQAVADAYNEANALTVGGELPDILDTEKEK